METETLDAIEHFDRCFYGYDVSEVPAPTAPPPLSELRVAPRAVDDLVSSLADDEDALSGVHVRVETLRTASDEAMMRRVEAELAMGKNPS